MAVSQRFLAHKNLFLFSILTLPLRRKVTTLTLSETGIVNKQDNIGSPKSFRGSVGTCWERQSSSDCLQNTSSRHCPSSHTGLSASWILLWFCPVGSMPLHLCTHYSFPWLEHPFPNLPGYLLFIFLIQLKHQIFCGVVLDLPNKNSPFLLSASLGLCVGGIARICKALYDLHTVLLRAFAFALISAWNTLLLDNSSAHSSFSLCLSSDATFSVRFSLITLFNCSLPYWHVPHLPCCAMFLSMSLTHLFYILYHLPSEYRHVS